MSSLLRVQDQVDLLTSDMKEQISDWYHTFKELYSHRIKLFIALCNTLSKTIPEFSDSKDLPWKAKLHFDGTMWDWWFIAGIWQEKWRTLTYHIPMSEWDNLFAWEINNAPEWDWHTSDDVINLLSKI